MRTVFLGIAMAIAVSLMAAGAAVICIVNFPRSGATDDSESLQSALARDFESNIVAYEDGWRDGALAALPPSVRERINENIETKAYPWLRHSLGMHWLRGEIEAEIDGLYGTAAETQPEKKMPVDEQGS